MLFGSLSVRRWRYAGYTAHSAQIPNCRHPVAVYVSRLDETDIRGVCGFHEIVSGLYLSTITMNQYSYEVTRSGASFGACFRTICVDCAVLSLLCGVLDLPVIAQTPSEIPMH